MKLVVPPGCGAWGITQKLDLTTGAHGLVADAVGRLAGGSAGSWRDATGEEIVRVRLAPNA